jgi:hypothetical protein
MELGEWSQFAILSRSPSLFGGTDRLIGRLDLDQDGLITLDDVKRYLTEDFEGRSLVSKSELFFLGFDAVKIQVLPEIFNQAALVLAKTVLAFWSAALWTGLEGEMEAVTVADVRAAVKRYLINFRRARLVAAVHRQDPQLKPKLRAIQRVVDEHVLLDFVG